MCVLPEMVQPYLPSSSHNERSTIAISSVFAHAGGCYNQCMGRWKHDLYRLGSSAASWISQQKLRYCFLSSFTIASKHPHAYLSSSLELEEHHVPERLQLVFNMQDNTGHTCNGGPDHLTTLPAPHDTACPEDRIALNVEVCQASTSGCDPALITGQVRQFLSQRSFVYEDQCIDTSKAEEPLLTQGHVESIRICDCDTDRHAALGTRLLFWQVNCLQCNARAHGRTGSYNPACPEMGCHLVIYKRLGASTAHHSSWIAACCTQVHLNIYVYQLSEEGCCG